MSITQNQLKGPYSHRHLIVYLVYGAQSVDLSTMIPLQDALDQKIVTVQESGQIGRLVVENISENLDVFIQAGDVVRGGYQDRTLGADFILPRKSGQVRIPSFCVEHGRWHRRGNEEAGRFSSSKHSLHGKDLKLAAILHKNQQAVWEHVNQSHAKLSQSIQGSVTSQQSPSSYELARESVELEQACAEYREALKPVIEDQSDAIGLAILINTKPHAADVYGSTHLFAKLKSKLIDAAIIETIAERNETLTSLPKKIKSHKVKLQEWFREIDRHPISHNELLPPRTQFRIYEGCSAVAFETVDQAAGNNIIHRSYIQK